jgi:hypothetical protein
MSRASGEWPSLQRPIDFDPNELTVEEKIFRNLKRLGAILAVVAVRSACSISPMFARSMPRPNFFTMAAQADQ